MVYLFFGIFRERSTAEISSVFNGSITVAAWIPTERSNASAFRIWLCRRSIHIYAQLAWEVNICPLVGNTLISFNSPLLPLLSITNAHDGPVEDIAFNNTHRRLASIGHRTLQYDPEDDHKSFNCASRCRWSMSRLPGDSRSISCESTDRKKCGILWLWRSCSCILLGKSWSVSLLLPMMHSDTDTTSSVAYNVQPFSQKWSTQIHTRM